MKDFLTVKAYTKWLGEIGRGAKWEDEMQALEDNCEDYDLKMRGAL